MRGLSLICIDLASQPDPPPLHSLSPPIRPVSSPLSSLPVLLLPGASHPPAFSAALSFACSKWGWCGSNSSYCGAGCKNGPCSASFRRITYFPNWSGIDPSTFQVNHFTHIVYAFAAISPLNYTVSPRVHVPHLPIRSFIRAFQAPYKSIII
ncbi:unnamed protein product [Closterium sp. NIES-53]